MELRGTRGKDKEAEEEEVAASAGREVEVGERMGAGAEIEAGVAGVTSCPPCVAAFSLGEMACVSMMW